MPDHPDPGWARAVPRGLAAIFARGTVMKHRPAIVAARAMVLACFFSSVIILALLASLGEVQGADSIWAVLWVLVASGVSIALVLWFRYRPSYKGPRVPDDPVVLFVNHVALIAATALISTLAGFVFYFLDGGSVAFGLGLVVTWALLFLPGRPSAEMAAAMVAVSPFEVTGEELWQMILDPDPEERPA